MAARAKLNLRERAFRYAKRIEGLYRGTAEARAECWLAGYAVGLAAAAKARNSELKYVLPGELHYHTPNCEAKGCEMVLMVPYHPKEKPQEPNSPVDPLAGTRMVR